MTQPFTIRIPVARYLELGGELKNGQVVDPVSTLHAKPLTVGDPLGINEINVFKNLYTIEIRVHIIDD